MLLSTVPAHRSKTTFTYLARDLSTSLAPVSSSAAVSLHRLPLTGKPRALSTVLEAPTPVANSPEPGQLPPGGAASVPPAPAPAAAPVPVPGSVPEPVPVTVPPRVSSLHVGGAQAASSSTLTPELERQTAAPTNPGTTTSTPTSTADKDHRIHRHGRKARQHPAPKGALASSLSTPSIPSTGIVSSETPVAAFAAASVRPLVSASAPAPVSAPSPMPTPTPTPASTLRPALASASSRSRCLASNDSFLDKPTATVDANMADNATARTPPRPRDSHDLSMSPRDITRDSLVVNMLLSLDQMSFGQSSADGPFGGKRGANTSTAVYDEEYSPRPWSDDSNTSSRERNDTVNHNRHWRRSSGSSDVDSIVVDDSAKRPSNPPASRGRHGNSTSNNVMGQFPRLNSMRETTYKPQPGTPPRSSHTRGRRQSNKSSSSASLDMGYPHGTVNQRLAPRTGRSASFDYGPQSQSQIPQPSSSSPFLVDFAGAMARDEYGAAPTPTVPSGPRREASGRPIPPPPPEPVEPRTLERKRSTSRSLRSSSGRNRRGGTAHQASAQAQASMRAEDLESAPAPSVGYGKSKESVTTANANHQPKERPGFFRRVFGSSKSTAPSNSSISAPQTSSSRLPISSPDRTLLHQQQPTTPTTSTSVAPPKDVASSHSHQHPTLQKKSSFFRRRKKSVADEAQPLPNPELIPPVPLLDSSNFRTAKDELSGQDMGSPTSSLRQVMNPYLRDGVTGLGLTGVAVSRPLSDITNTPSSKSDTIGETRNEEYKRDFSPDYEPSPNARIRKVNPESDSERMDGTPCRPKSKQPYETLDASNSSLDFEAGSDDADHRHKHQKKSEKPSSTATTRRKDTEDRDATIRARRKKPVLDFDNRSKLPTQTSLNLLADGVGSVSLASSSTETGYRTAPSAPPSVLVEEIDESGSTILPTLESMKSHKRLDEPELVMGEPTEDDRQKARRIFDGGEDFIQKDRAAAWMGEQGPVRQRTLQAYMEMYDFAGLNILVSLRQICGRLVLRAETQQVDRILVAFSKRWCNCNPMHGFKATDVIHMICYSIMLLNTDLHLADIESKMTRSQFVKNTMTTITQAVAESAPGAFVRPSILPEKNPILSPEPTRQAMDPSRTNRHSFRPSPRNETNYNDIDECGPLVKSPYNGPRKGWEEQVEIVLKSIYASIRDQRLPLFGAEQEKNLNVAPSQSNLSVIGMLKRSPSVLSKAPSETLSTRGRAADGSRNNTSRWTSKSRSRPGLGRNGFSSSRTSFDDGNSMWSPAMSSATWSKHSLGRTQGSMSQDSFASSMPRGDYQKSIGFANALSQAIIRDVDTNGQETVPSIVSADMSSAQFLEDESLELAGPPWVKEGRVMHKHHLDGYGKRAKDRNWTEVFAVVQKGQISLFSFNASKSLRQKSRSRQGGKLNGPVGGGNWQDNAVNLGTFNLRLTLASALPPPGYSRSRPHVWALSLPTGAVHLFHVGTPEITREFVNTANYWSARLSSHPLVGGISNIEYGWSSAIVNNSLVNAINESATAGESGGRNPRPGSSATHARKSSAASGSIRGPSFDQAAGPFTSSGRGKLPGDRIHIAEWAPPTQSMRSSNATETEQLETLTTYVKSIEQELQSHNQLRSPMLLAFTPRGHNAGKAMANWERKSAYLLREIVKFRTYVDCLQQAEARKQEIYAERDAAQKASQGDLSDGDMELSGDEEGDETLRP
ncbi:guanine nucleotide exchange factor [Metarhizium robertsii ARSEF 23]|uniref:Guanine nucleotide exchange factor n=1 Tax=Metarhizium robertsii (strain ARSEF 23 / ATCC MYA-3075) TaxID=655844 RepID=E9EX86_METRA|nr:guanine nucleotide exchange factor [Metarhizium robertsii ARSEF 23]EFY99706.1 guanine nucleotide exchange factor [Metarhizium robertsii ARSEF 23]